MLRRALVLVLVLSLAACTHHDTPAATPTPGGLDTAQIEVTPLEAPGAAAPAANPGAEAAPVAAQSASAAAAPVEAVPVAVATASTPHPKPRPAGLATGQEAAPEPPPPKSEPQLQCEAQGGIWDQPGGAGGFLCQKPLRDGGKVCHKKGDCLGECLARSQTCAPASPLMGCNDVLDSEGRAVTLCLD